MFRRICGCLFVVLVATGQASAQTVTRGDVARLARRAAQDGDRAALRELRRISVVAGRPVDLDAALDVSGRALDARLEALARRGYELPEADAGALARDILSERRFRGTALPQPLRRPLEALADRLRDLGKPLRALVDALPGEGSIEWVILALLVAVASTFVALRLARRRARLPAASQDGVPVARADPGRLESEAATAEARGDLERALRLRFAAGLMRLDSRRAIVLSPSLTTGEVARRLASREFDRLAAIFDEVVYGKRPPTGNDVDQTRASWDRVLAEARPR